MDAADLQPVQHRDEDEGDYGAGDDAAHGGEQPRGAVLCYFGRHACGPEHGGMGANVRRITPRTRERHDMMSDEERPEHEGRDWMSSEEPSKQR